MDDCFLTGVAQWSFDHELAEVDFAAKMFTGVTSFAGPLHYHKCYIGLSNAKLIIEGINRDIDLTISLDSITEIYIGFDDIFPAFAAKNLGIFWQPLRIKYSHSLCIYLIIDHNGIFSHDKEWFESLKDLLS